MRFRFGAGSFARHKRVFLHLNFARSTVARGRQNAHTNDVQKAVGSFHASVTIEDPAEVPPAAARVVYLAIEPQSLLPSNFADVVLRSFKTASVP